MKKIFLALLGFVGLFLFTGCDSKPTVTTITNTVTNTVIVTNEVIKEVSAEIPKEYLDAYRLEQNLKTATPISNNKALFQMKDICIIYSFDDAAQKVVSKDEAKAKFELTLRRNGININSDSPNKLIVWIGGFFDNDATTLNFSIKCFVGEPQYVVRNGEFHTETVTVWECGNYYGYAGKLKAEDVILNQLEKDAEVFANDFLSANPKSN